MSLGHSPSVVTNGLVYYHDMGNTEKSWKGAPTTNYVTNPSTMAGWNNYSNIANGTPAAFVTQFGTTGYKMDWVGSWNGVYKSVTVPSAGTYTFSAWIKWIGGSSNVTGGAVYISGWGGADSASATNRTLPGQWQRISITLNCTNTTVTFYLICWGGTNNADNSSWQVTMPQVEAGSVATPFVDGTRTTSNNIIDLTGTNTVTATSLTYNSNNTFSFNGSSDMMTNSVAVSNQSSTNFIGRSWVATVKPSSSITAGGIFGHVLGSGCTYYCNGGLTVWDGKYAFCWYDNASYQFLDSGVTATVGQYVQIAGTYNPVDNKARIYVNGILKNTGASTNLNYGNFAYQYQIGYLSASTSKFAGTIDQLMWYYNKTLTDTEVLQNFNVHKGRYGL